MSEIDETLNDRWIHKQIAEKILLQLTREQQARYYLQLRDYVRWLLGRREKQDALSEFERRLVASDASLEEKVKSGELNEAQASQVRGDRIWARAFEETRSAAFYMALKIMFERKLGASLRDKPEQAEETIEALQNQIEEELAEKLRQCLKINEM